MPRHARWIQDGPDAWKANLGSNRVARIRCETNQGVTSFVTRLTGDDPGGEYCGGYPSLEAAQMRFEPGWSPASDIELMKPTAAQRQTGKTFNVGAEFKARLASPGDRGANPPIANVGDTARQDANLAGTAASGRGDHEHPGEDPVKPGQTRPAPLQAMPLPPAPGTPGNPAMGPAPVSGQVVHRP